MCYPKSLEKGSKLIKGLMDDIWLSISQSEQCLRISELYIENISLSGDKIISILLPYS